MMKEAIEAIVKGMIKSTILVGKVVAFDANTYTCTVKLNVNDLDIDEVRCVAVIGNVSGTTPGIFIQPKMNSYVLVGIIDNDINQTFIAQFGQIESFKIIATATALNGDTHGGLIKIDNLKTQYDANFNAVKTACVAAFTALAALDGSASLNAFNAASSAITALNKTSLENTKVKHG
jgi:hypothetical protein